MKLHLISFTLMNFIFSAGVQAQSARIDPCPNALAIKQSGFREVLQMGNEFIAYQISNFNTKTDWRFTTMTFKADSKQQAYVLAMNELETIQGSPVVNYDTKTKIWSCTYKMKNNFTGTATTPIY